MLACNSLELVKFLVQEFGKDQLSYQCEVGTVLIASIASGNHAVFNYLLYDLKVDPNLCDSLGNSPLYIAVYKGDHAFVKHLLKVGADPKLTGT